MAEVSVHSPAPAPHALLAGGGTGGHVFPALAVAEELSERGWRITYCGRPESFEERVARGRGLHFEALPARPLVGRGLVGKLAALALLALGALRGRKLVRRVGADVVLGTGGFVAAPAVLGARLAGRPCLLLELNARAGVANRWLSRWASEAATAWPETAGQLHCPANPTGVPVRRAFVEAARAAAPPAPGATARLLVLGGSQGARELNELLPPALAAVVAAGTPLSILHQCGASQVAATRASYRQYPELEVRVEPFLEDVAAAMGAADLVVSRAGAVTLAELAVSGRASLLLPLTLAGAHQEYNARAFEEAGAARRLEAGITAEQLAAAIGALLAEPGARAAMGARARAVAHPEAAAAVADRLADLTRRRAA